MSKSNKDLVTPGAATPTENAADKPKENFIDLSESTPRSDSDEESEEDEVYDEDEEKEEDDEDEKYDGDDENEEDEEGRPKFVLAPTKGNSLSSHQHIHLPIERFQASEKPWRLIFHQRHKGTDLAELLQAFCGRSNQTMTAMQLDAYDLFHDSNEQEHATFDLEKGGITDHKMLVNYFYIFDKFFFLGCLRGWYSGIKISVVEGTTTQFHGRCVDIVPIGIRDALQPLKLHIMISGSNNEDRKMRLTFYLGTLLHQMVHAFLALGSCQLFGCNYKHKNEGTKGHGEAWQDIAYAVEKGVKKTFGLNFDLGREWAYVWELVAPGSRTVSKRMLDWGFVGREVLKQVDCCYRTPEYVYSRSSCVDRRRPMTFKKAPAAAEWANPGNEGSGRGSRSQSRE